MQEADLYLVTFVELLDSSGATLVRQAAKWNGASFELELDEDHTQSGRTICFFDAGGGVVGKMRFTSSKLAPVCMADGGLS